MDLIINEPGMVFWQLGQLLAILLFVVSWSTILISKRLSTNQKLVWLLGTMFLPIAGPVIFLVRFFSQQGLQNAG